MNRFNTAFAALISNEDGQGMVEYALVLALVSVVAIAALQAVGGNLGGTLGQGLDGPQVGTGQGGETLMTSRCRSGMALVEFALVLPIFLTMLLGVVDVGYLYNHQLILTNAAREGARSGSLGETEAQIRTTVTTYLQISGYAPLPPESDISVVLSDGEAQVTIQSTVPFLFGSSGAPITLKAATRMRRDT